MAEHESPADQHHHDEDHGSGHHEELHAPPGNAKYIVVFVSLVMLTICSFIIGNSEAIMSTPSVGWTGMLAVSCAKAMLVILFFMHLKWEANWKYVLTIPASMMSLFLLVMLVPDVGCRTVRYSEARWLHAAEESPSSGHEADQAHEDAAHEDAGHDEPAHEDAAHEDAGHDDVSVEAERVD